MAIEAGRVVALRTHHVEAISLERCVHHAYLAVEVGIEERIRESGGTRHRIEEPRGSSGLSSGRLRSHTREYSNKEKIPTFICGLLPGNGFIGVTGPPVGAPL